MFQLDRAEQIFPGMVFDGVAINKLRRSFKVLTVNSQTANLARFHMSTSTVRILRPDEDESAATEPSAAASAGIPGGELRITNVPGLSNQIAIINRFLGGFGRNFWVKDERESCAFVIHGGHGTGKTFILQRLAATQWGKAHWIRPSDKLSTVREVFKLAQAQQPSLILIDGLEDLVHKDRTNRDAVIEAIGDELDALSASAKLHGRLPNVVVVATCLDYMTDVPAKLQKRSRLRENIALPIPRAPERLEILEFLNPPLRQSERAQCLTNISSRTHAYNGDDLANLVLNAKRILGNRLDGEVLPASEQGEGEMQQEHFLQPDDMELALRITRPTAMHDINLNPPTIHWNDVGGQDNLKKVLSRMIKNTKVCHFNLQPPHPNLTRKTSRIQIQQATGSYAIHQKVFSSTVLLAAPRHYPPKQWPPSPRSTSSPSRVQSY
jgi:AAA family ATPase